MGEDGGWRRWIVIQREQWGGAIQSFSAKRLSHPTPDEEDGGWMVEGGRVDGPLLFWEQSSTLRGPSRMRPSRTGSGQAPSPKRMGIGDWVLGIGDWRFGIRDWGGCGTSLCSIGGFPPTESNTCSTSIIAQNTRSCDMFLAQFYSRLADLAVSGSNEPMFYPIIPQVWRLVNKITVNLMEICEILMLGCGAFGLRNAPKDAKDADGYRASGIEGSQGSLKSAVRLCFLLPIVL